MSRLRDEVQQMKGSSEVGALNDFLHIMIT